MKFHDAELDSLNPKEPKDLSTLLGRLCGERVIIGCLSEAACGRCQQCMNWTILGKRVESNSFTLEQFNDILLLSNQRQVSRAFFEFFFRPTAGQVTFDQIRRGISTFEGFAMLRFGNVRYAFRKLYELDSAELQAELGEYSNTPDDLLKGFRGRLDKPGLPMEVAADKTWLLGYIARGAADHDFATYYAMATLLGQKAESEFIGKLDEIQQTIYRKRKEELGAANGGWREQFADLESIRSPIEELQEKLKQTRQNGWLNTTHYLALDFMDVYVATSMREKWEFEDTG